MIDFAHHSPFDNFSGIRFFRFIPEDHVRSIPGSPIDTIRIVNGPLILKTGKRWFYGYAAFQTADYKEKGGGGPHGPTYKFSFNGFLPLISATQSQNVSDMEEHRFLLDCIDNNGNRKLVGNLETPLAFESSEDVKPPVGAPNGNGYAFSFFGELYPKSPGYVDIDILPPDWR